MSSRYDDPEYQKQVSLQALASHTLAIACRCIVDLRIQLKELEKKMEVLQKDSDELNAAKRQVFNMFTGGKLFPGDNK